MFFSKPKNIRKAQIIILIVITALLAGLCVSFILGAKKNLENEKIQYLTEISKQGANLVENQIQGNIETLEAMSIFMSSHEDFYRSHSMEILKKEADNGKFKRIGLAFPDGTCETTDGNSFNVSERQWFQRGLEGKCTVNGPLSDYVDGKAAVVLAVPIEYEQEVVAVLFATQGVDTYHLLLEKSIFGGEGYSYLINSDGEPVTITTHKNSIGQYDNLFTEMDKISENKRLGTDLKEKLKEGKDGNLEFVNDDEKKNLSYTKVGVNDWYLISVVSSDITSKYSSLLLFRISAAVIVVLAMILCGIYVINKIYKRSQEELEEMAFKDTLMGHGNLNYFFLESSRLLDNKNCRAFSILQFDIDKFKAINDIYGHEMGSAILRHIGSVLDSVATLNECWARVATDNFILLVKEDEDACLIHRVEVITEQVEKYIEGYHIELTFGIYKIEDLKSSINTMSDKASLARLFIKNTARDINYHFFDEDIRLKFLKEREIENSLKDAIDKKELKVYLQPKYSLKNEEILGAEALVRWEKEDHEIIPPDAFIWILEKKGSIKLLDLYMFEEACCLLEKWNYKKPISVNFSRVTLKEKNLGMQLLKIAQFHNIHPKQLEIEITESAVTEELEVLQKCVSEFRMLGFLVSIDDFGSGYSSLNILKNLEIDIIKLDKGFLDDSLDQEKGKLIIRNLISMAKDLSLTIVAEGVETKEQAEFLAAAGCDIAQGYHYSRPINVKEFEKLTGMEQ